MTRGHLRGKENCFELARGSSYGRFELCEGNTRYGTHEGNPGEIEETIPGKSKLVFREDC